MQNQSAAASKSHFLRDRYTVATAFSGTKARIDHKLWSHLQVLLQRVRADAAHCCEGRQQLGNRILLKGLPAVSGIRRQQQLHCFAQVQRCLLKAQVPLLPLVRLPHAAVTICTAAITAACVCAAGNNAV